MGISDWSSDVCSSDLHKSDMSLTYYLTASDSRRSLSGNRAAGPAQGETRSMLACLILGDSFAQGTAWELRSALDSRDRKSVVSGKGLSVRVDLGGRRNINKKQTRHMKHRFITY